MKTLRWKTPRKKLWWIGLGATGLFGLCCLGSLLRNRDNKSNSRIWLTAINPGNEVTGTLVYDLPHGVELAQLELHESLASAGAKVDLR